jgi:hypothetical protein
MVYAVATAAMIAAGVTAAVVMVGALLTVATADKAPV